MVVRPICPTTGPLWAPFGPPLRPLGPTHRWAKSPGYLEGSPNPANNSTADGVDFRLSLAFLFLPMFVWRRVRRFQVWRVFDAIAGGFYQGPTLASTEATRPNHAYSPEPRGSRISAFPCRPSCAPKGAQGGRDWFSRALGIQLESCRPGTPRPRRRRRRRRWLCPRWAPPDLW